MENSPIDFASAATSRASFTCEPKAIADAAEFLAKRILERRNTIPILSYVRIDAAPGGTVTLTGSDLDVWASVAVAAAVSSPGAFCVDAFVLADVLAKARKEKDCWEVTIADADGRALVKAHRGRYNVPSLPIDDFPLPIGGIEPTLSAFTVPAGQFIADLAALAPCMSADETKYYLRGVALQALDMAGRESLVLAATDGFQMGIASRALPAGAGALPDGIIPAKAVAALIAARKLAPDSEALALDCPWKDDGTGFYRFALGPISLACKAIDGTFPDWTRAWLTDLAPTEAQAALFPDLLPGAPLALIDKLGKPFKGALSWSPARNGQIGTVAGDDGLVFGVMNLTEADACGKKGFSYTVGGGTGEIEAPDGHCYPVAFSDHAIHLSAAQVRALIGESCFETMVVPYGNGKMNVHILKWLWEQGDSRFLTVRADGRTWAGGEYVTRAEIEAALAGEMQTVDSLAGAESDFEPAACHGAESLSGAPTGEFEAAEVDAACKGPMFQGVPWPEIFAEIDGGYEGVRLECCDDVVSMVNAIAPQRNGLQRTRIPARHQARARLSFDLQASRFAAIWEAAEAPESEWVCAPDVYDSQAGPVDLKDNAPELDAMAALIERIEALEARLATLPAESEKPLIARAPDINEAAPISGKQRSPAHERAIRAYLAARRFKHNARKAYSLKRTEGDQLRERITVLEVAAHKAMGERLELQRERDSFERLAMIRKDKRAVSVSRAMTLRRELDAARLKSASAMARMEKDSGLRWVEWDKRRRSTMLARQRGRDMVTMAGALWQNAAQFAQANADLETARRSPTYFSADDGQERLDHVGRAAHHARTAIERADTLSGELREARAAMARMEGELARLADAMLAENLRAVRAERALAAVTARRNGWPPAVQSVRVSYAA